MLEQKNYNFNVIELYYYYFYLLKLNNNIFFFSQNNSLINFFLNYKFFFMNKKKFVFKKINKYINYNIIYKFNNFNDFKNNDCTVVKNRNNFKNYLKQTTSPIFIFFNLFFLFNYSLFNSTFKPHSNFKIFYIYHFSDKIILIDSSKFLIRWKESYDFLFNIFFYNFNPIIFGSNIFKNEILSLNWNYNNFDINLWKYYFPFFIFKLTNYNKKTDFFFDKLSILNINFFLITDCIYHFKNLHYIKKKNFYSIGLINIEIDPWMVSYPIVNFFESYLTQLFFFKFLLFIEKKSIFLKFKIFKKMWITLLLMKTLK